MNSIKERRSLSSKIFYNKNINEDIDELIFKFAYYTCIQKKQNKIKEKLNKILNQKYNKYMFEYYVNTLSTNFNLSLFNKWVRFAQKIPQNVGILCTLNDGNYYMTTNNEEIITIIVNEPMHSYLLVSIINNKIYSKAIVGLDDNWQLGVEFSSNNAGDGPIVEIVGFKNVNNIYINKNQQKYFLKDDTYVAYALPPRRVKKYKNTIFHKISILFRKHSALVYVNSKQHGTKYSSNNAGDGPTVAIANKITLETKLSGCENSEDSILFTDTNGKPVALILIYTELIIVMSKQYRHKLCQKIKDITAKKVIFELVEDYSHQLGVMYSSNNAGDGPSTYSDISNFIQNLDNYPGTKILRDHNEKVMGSIECMASGKVFIICIEQWLYDYLITKISDTNIQVLSVSQTSFNLMMFQQSGQKEWTIDLIEDLVLFLYSCSRASGKDDLVIPLITFIKSRTKKSMISNIQESRLWKKFMSLFQEDNEVSIQQQSFTDVIALFREYFDNFEQLSDNPLFLKIKKFILYALSTSVLDRFGIAFDDFKYTAFEAEAIRRKFNSKLGLVKALADLLLFICEKGMQVYHSGEVSCIFHSGKTYDQWKTQYDVLVRQSQHLSRAKELNFSEESYDQDLEKLILKGESIKKFSMNNTKLEKTLINNAMNTLYSLRDDRILSKSISKERKIPFSILINGTSGIGKSTIKELLFKLYAKRNKLPSNDDSKYVRCPDDEYWSEYKTHKYCIIMDDVAFINPSASQGVDPSCMEFLKVINSVPYVTNQAAIEDKGKIPLSCKLVLATTNVKDLNAYHYFSCPSAVQRRFPYIIEPKVKSEYSSSGGMLDSSKVPKDSLPDYWTWSVSRVEPQIDPEKRKFLAETTKLLDNVDMPTFLRWYYKAMDEHEYKLARVEESMNVIDNIEVCQVCYKFNCNDNHLQSSVECVMWLRLYAIAMFYVYINYVYSFVNHPVIVWLSDKIGTLSYIDKMNKYIQYITSKTNTIWTMFGDKQYRKLTPKSKQMLELAVMVTTFLSVYTISCAVSSTIFKLVGKKNKNTVQRQTGDIEVRPEPDDIERPNVWYKKEFGLSKMDVSNESSSISKFSMEQFYNMISKNVVSFYNMSAKTVNHAVCLKGNLYVCNAHFLSGDFRLKVKNKNANQVDSSFECEVTMKDFIIKEELDLAFIVLRQCPPKKDITKYFMDKYIDIRGNGFYSLMRMGEEPSLMPVSCIKNKYVANRQINCWGWEAISSTPTQFGDCGSPICMMSARGPIILGIHACGIADHAISVSITKDIIRSLEIPEQFDVQLPQLQSRSAPREVGELHRKSVFRYIDSGTAEVYGSFVGHRGNVRTDVCKTPICEYMENLGVEVKYTKPVMKGYKPWRIAALDMVNIPNEFDNSVLETVKKDFLYNILGKLPKKELNLLQVYDTFTSVNGAPGVSYVDRINCNTSAGNPFRKSKRNYLINVPPVGELLDPVMPTEEILERVEHIENSYKKGKIVKPNFCAHLKDEPVSFKKSEMGKTRVFTGAPFDWSIVVRKYLLSFIRVLQRNRYIFEAGPGTIAQSKEWDDLYKYLTHFGTDRIVAGDYKAFDKKMQPGFILAAYDIIHDILKESGNYSEDQLRVVRGIAIDTAYPLIDFNGDLVQFYGSNPSGHPLTVIINSLANSLYMRYCYVLLNPNKEARTFQDNVNLMTYGDDNIMGVSSKISWFNHTAISKVLSNIGITYTMADKEAESVPYITIESATFLKRSWRLDKDLNKFLAPLDEDSIEKMLTVWTRSRSVTEQEQIISVIASACREYFFYGKEIFNIKRQMFQDIISQHDLESWQENWVLPTHQELVDTYNNMNELL